MYGFRHRGGFQLGIVYTWLMGLWYWFFEWVGVGCGDGGMVDVVIWAEVRMVVVARMVMLV